MNSYLTKIFERRKWVYVWDLIYSLVSRDLRLLYTRSTLGFGWALALPLLQLLIYTLIFRQVLTTSIERYPAYVFIGVLVFGWFQSTINEAGGLITGSKALVTQPGFPLSLLPHVKASVRLFHFLISLPVLFGMLIYFGIKPSMHWFSIPVLILVQYLLIVGISYPIASINVVFRDMQHIISVTLQLSMFLTPVFYSVHQIPDGIRPYFYLNPMVGILESWRQVLIHNVWPDITVMISLLAVAIIMVTFGRYLFVRQSHRFAEEIS